MGRRLLSVKLIAFADHGDDWRDDRGQILLFALQPMQRGYVDMARLLLYHDDDEFICPM